MGKVIQNKEAYGRGKSHLNSHKRELTVSPEFRVGMEARVVVEEFAFVCVLEGSGKGGGDMH